MVDFLAPLVALVGHHATAEVARPALAAVLALMSSDASVKRVRSCGSRCERTGASRSAAQCRCHLTQRAVYAALQQKCAATNACCQMVPAPQAAEAGVVPACLQLMERCSDDATALLAARLLHAVAGVAGCRDKAVTSGALPALAALLLSQSAATLTHALQALYHVVRRPQHVPAAGTVVSVPRLAELVDHTDASVASEAQCVLVHLAGSFPRQATPGLCFKLLLLHFPGIATVFLD